MYCSAFVTRRRVIGAPCAMALLALLPVAALAQVPTPTPPMHSEFLHMAAPDYPVPYGRMPADEITKVLERVRTFVDGVTPTRLVRRSSGETVADPSQIDDDTTIDRGSFLIVSYEWGVTYSGMLAVAEATGDASFKDYAARRLKFMAEIYPRFKARMTADVRDRRPMRSVVRPMSLDDSGSMCAAMIKAHRAGVQADLRPMIDNYMNYISTGQLRLADGTLARGRPEENSLWLDDLYMSVPALAQMGKLTGERRYYDDAVKQILQFAERMFVKEKGLYMHGWVQGMEPHPAFLWARANGWALMAKVELLEVLPEDHPGRAAVLDLLRAHIRGLAACQSGAGIWNQLLDRPDTYLETSASAMFVYGIARAINRGWIDSRAYGPMVQLGWNAVTAKVNTEGQVEGTCVGTGMGFDPTFYYYRPTSVYAAHGYGPVLLAGAEMLTLLKSGAVEINDGAAQFTRPRAKR
jgi:unsaturated rhamnogalacturonyl hydrolase